MLSGLSCTGQELSIMMCSTAQIEPVWCRNNAASFVSCLSKSNALIDNVTILLSALQYKLS